MAAFIIAAAYLGMGLILVGLATMSGDTGSAPIEQSAPEPDKTSDTPPILQAFMYGMQAGAQADQKRHSRGRS